MKKIDIRFNKNNFKFYCIVDHTICLGEKELQDILSRVKEKIDLLIKEKVIKYFAIYEKEFKQACHRIRRDKVNEPEKLLIAQATPEIYELKFKTLESTNGKFNKSISIYPTEDFKSIHVSWVHLHLVNEFDDFIDAKNGYTNNIVSLIIRSNLEKVPYIGIANFEDKEKITIYKNQDWCLQYSEMFHFYEVEFNGKSFFNSETISSIRNQVLIHLDSLGKNHGVCKFFMDQFSKDEQNKNRFSEEYREILDNKLIVAVIFDISSKDVSSLSKDLMMGSYIFLNLINRIGNLPKIEYFEKRKNLINLDSNRISEIIKIAKSHGIA